MDSLNPNTIPTSLSKSLRTNEDHDVVTRRLSNDLLESIADRLGIIELLHFRCVCKDWYSASFSSSAQIELFRQPWFLLYGETVQCLVSSEADKKYSLNVSELDHGAECLASDKGWLLVMKNRSIYFFCVFSGAKIMLPELPVDDNWNYLAAFSSPPTSPDCKVCFFRQDRSSDSNELYVLFRGATIWDKEMLNSMKKTYFKTIRAASFQGNEVYLMDEIDGLIIHDCNKKDTGVYRIVKREPECSENSMPFYPQRNYFSGTKMAENLGLEGRVSLTTCGTRLLASQKQLDTVVFGESINLPLHEDEESITRNLKGVWIHPRFFQVSPSYQW